MMEPHMIDNELYSFVFVIWVNHVGFIIPNINSESKIEYFSGETSLICQCINISFICN